MNSVEARLPKIAVQTISAATSPALPTKGRRITTSKSRVTYWASCITSSGEVTEKPIKGPPPMAYSFTYSADRKKAYGIMEDLIVLDLETSSIARTLPNAEGTSYSVIPTRDGKKLYVGAGGSTITVYDAETLKVLKVLQTHADACSLRKVTF